MKKQSKYSVSIFLSSLLLMGFLSLAAHAQPGTSISFETFYNELSPYGSWVQNPDYGYVWIPDVPNDFQPYATDGHWIMTDRGNMWVSDFNWGWAAFHYGRWFFDDYYGWAWVPGREWGPSWVAWRSGGGYYGWAPLGPRFNISVNVGNYIPDPYWVFVRQRYFCSPRIYRYFAPRRRVNYIVHQTTIINNTYVYNNRPAYYTGPQAADVQRVTRQRVPVYQVERAARPGRGEVRNGTVSVYQPTVRTAVNGVAPSRVVRGSEARSNRSAVSRQPASDRNQTGRSRSSISRERNNAGSFGQTTPARSTERSDYSPNTRATRNNGDVENNRTRTSPARNSMPAQREIGSRQGRDSHSSGTERGNTYSPAAPARTASPRQRESRSRDMEQAPRSQPAQRNEQPTSTSPSRESSRSFSQPAQRSEQPTSTSPSRESSRSFSQPAPSTRQSAPARSSQEPSRSSSRQETAPTSRPSGSRGSGRPPRN